jgi:hypothetical protein
MHSEFYDQMRLYIIVFAVGVVLGTLYYFVRWIYRRTR